jgi:hypothetical protein
LPMDASMMWCFPQINQTCHKVVGEFVEWYTLNLVKYDNAF